MAHELNFTDGTADFFEVGRERSAWHREGILLPDAPTLKEAIQLIHADYEVAKVPTKYQYRETDGSLVEADSKLAFLTVRTDTMRELGSVGPLYKVVQNEVAFEKAIGTLLESGLIVLETGAVLRGGATAFLLGRLSLDFLGPLAEQFFRQERILPYVGITTDHSGKRGNFMALTTVRWVCANTLGIDEVRAAKLEKSGQESDEQIVTIRHTGDAEAKHAAAAEKLLGGIVERAEAMAKSFRLLKEFVIDDAQFERLVLRPSIGRHPYDRPEFNPDAKLADMVVERYEKRRESITWLWTNGKGHVGDHSAWEAYNGLVEAIDHDEKLFPSRSGVYRLGSLLNGELREKKNRVRGLLDYAAQGLLVDGDDGEGN